MSAKHTPTPLQKIEFGTDTEDRFVVYVDRKHAAFIIRAVNSHDELLDACKQALGAFENNNAIDWSILEKAISKAEGKS